MDGPHYWKKFEISILSSPWPLNAGPLLLYCCCWRLLPVGRAPPGDCPQPMPPLLPLPRGELCASLPPLALKPPRITFWPLPLEDLPTPLAGDSAPCWPLLPLAWTVFLLAAPLAAVLPLDDPPTAALSLRARALPLGESLAAELVDPPRLLCLCPPRLFGWSGAAAAPPPPGGCPLGSGATISPESIVCVWNKLCNLSEEEKKTALLNTLHTSGGVAMYIALQAKETNNIKLLLNLRLQVINFMRDKTKSQHNFSGWWNKKHATTSSKLLTVQYNVGSWGYYTGMVSNPTGDNWTLGGAGESSGAPPVVFPISPAAPKKRAEC